jgi:diguanylate cyclase (GGDEF)-like protein
MGRGKLSLRATIRLTLMLVVWSVILTATALFGAMRHQERGTIARQQAAMIAGVAAQDLVRHVQNVPREPLSTWLKQVSRWPAVEGLALLQDGEAPLVSAGEPTTAFLQTAGGEHAEAAFLWTGAAAENGKYQAIQVAPVSSESFKGKLVLALRLSNESPDMPIAWGFFAPLAMIGLLGVCIGILWLNHEVVRPIQILAKIGTDSGAGAEMLEPVSASRYEELAGVAQTLRCLHVNLDQWRSKADQLEKSFDRRVEEETRKINQTLQRTRGEVWRDPLTGLCNRRMLDENGTKLLEEQRREGGDFSVVMFDVDHFKTLNDTLGHMAGDEVLQFVAQLLKQAVRREDFAVRYGGDEFQLLLPGLSSAEAEQIAQRVVSLFGQHSKLLVSLDPKPSLSAGVASLATTNAKDIEELTHEADSAMYEAKRTGKNKVGVYDAKAHKAAAAPAKALVNAGRRMLSAMF